MAVYGNVVHWNPKLTPPSLVFVNDPELAVAFIESDLLFLPDLNWIVLQTSTLGTLELDWKKIIDQLFDGDLTHQRE